MITESMMVGKIRYWLVKRICRHVMDHRPDNES